MSANPKRRGLRARQWTRLKRANPAGTKLAREAAAQQIGLCHPRNVWFPESEKIEEAKAA